MKEEHTVNEELVLQLANIQKHFGGVHALKGVDFELTRGEVHALLGENGAGKSTLIKILTGVYHPDDGALMLKGQPVTIADPIDARHKGIAAIYQELSLIDTLTVAENIFLGNEPVATALGVSKKKKLYADSDAFLKRFGIPISSHALVGNLGLGQKRVIEIVKALAINAEILLLDEPTTGMSKAEIDTLFSIMQSLKEKNVTMIYISHYLDEVFRCCDRATVFRDGRNVDTFTMDAVTIPQLVRAMIGHSVSGERYRAAGDYLAEDTVLEAREYQTDAMQNPLSFAVHRGEIVGFTGIVGAGKSELAGSLFGYTGTQAANCCSTGNPCILKHRTIPSLTAWRLFPRIGKARACCWQTRLKIMWYCPIWSRLKTASDCWIKKEKINRPENGRADASASHECENGRRQPFRRQPAKGCFGEMADGRTRADPAGRTYAWH